MVEQTLEDRNVLLPKQVFSKGSREKERQMGLILKATNLRNPFSQGLKLSPASIFVHTAMLFLCVFFR